MNRHNKITVAHFHHHQQHHTQKKPAGQHNGDANTHRSYRLHAHARLSSVVDDKRHCRPPPQTNATQQTLDAIQLTTRDSRQNVKLAYDVNCIRRQCKKKSCLRHKSKAKLHSFESRRGVSDNGVTRASGQKKYEASKTLIGLARITQHAGKEPNKKIYIVYNSAIGKI